MPRRAFNRRVMRDEQHRSGPGRRRWLAGVVVIAAGAGAVLATGAFHTNKATGSGGAASGYKTGTQAVQRRTLISQTVVDATLGDAGSWNVVVPQSSTSGSSAAGGGAGAASGTFTDLPQVGRTLLQGQVAYRVSGAPVVLLYGNTPAYRDLSEGLTGPDVTELNQALLALGYAAKTALGPRSGWDYYSAETAYAVELLQAKLGLTETGILSLGEAVFLPGPALVTGWGATTVLGGAAVPGTVMLTASSTTPVVTIALDPGQQGEVKAGDSVSITLPDGAVTPGVISQISRVATSSTSGGGGTGGSGSANSPGGGSGSGSGSPGPTITVLATLIHPAAAGNLNSAPVTVTITQASVPNVLTVPVDALLAQAGGGYAVEVTGPGGHHLVTVSPGLFDDAAGLVQVTGDLAPGQHVVVPGL
jgi:peptidoglycan hydrolase-like protein with peptidoglycan-binding domain